MAQPVPLPRTGTVGNLTEQDYRHVQWQAELKGEDWSFVQSCVTKLFQLRKYPELVNDLPLLNDKISKLSKSNVAPFFGEFYQDQLLKKCMIILRQEIKEETGDVLLHKLGHIWTQFYTSILPTLQAFFAPVQLKTLSIRVLTLLSFRDIVVLKTSIQEALELCQNVPPEITQMLLVLQSVRQSPPSEQFYELQGLVSSVVHPYLCMYPNAPKACIKRHCSLGGEKDRRFVRLVGEDLKMMT